MFRRRNKDEWFRTLADTTTTAIVVHQEGTIVYCNKATSLITGYSNKELLQSVSIWDIAHPDFRNLVKQRATDRQKGDNAPSHYELKILCKDGSTKWLDFTAGTVTWKGKPAILTNAFDISQRKNAMETLSFHHRLWKLVANISAELIHTSIDNLDEKINDMLRKCGLFLDVDRTCLFQFSPDELYMSNTHEWCAEGVISGKNAMQNIPVNDIDWIREIVQKRKTLHVADADTLPDHLASIKERFKRHHLKSALVIPLIKNNHLLGYFGFDSEKRKEDAAETKAEMIKILGNILAEALARNRYEKDLMEARKQAESANQAKSLFLAHMSHEIRTPLNGVVGFIELLQKTPLNHSQRNYIENAIHSSRALTGVIDDILDFSRIEAGKMDLHPVITDIVSLAEQTTEMVKLEANKKQLALRLRLQHNMPRYALLDPLRVKQILVNLVNNAVKFTDKGEVELMVAFHPNHGEKGQFTFSVTDTGIGISAEEQKQLFSAFSQANHLAAKNFEGTGLGLSISQMLAEKMNSKISIESTPGKGSIFRFSLLTDFWFNVSQDASDASNGYADINQYQMTPVILIAEDNSTNLLLTKTMLLAALPEATVLEAYNGQQAVDVLEQKQVDLILMDVQMPGMDGLEATRLIRLKEAQSGISSSIPIVALTAGVIKEEKEKCLKAGMNEFLAKPLSEQALKDTLFSYLKPNTQTNQAQMKKPDREALQHFNMKELQERTELSREILLPMADISMSTLNNYLQSLAKVIQEGNETEVKSLAHTIKGLSLNMSFGHMTNLAKTMENQSEHGQQKVKELFEEMKKEWEIIRELVKNA